MELDRQSELNALRPDLLRFARLQLRDAGAAEDAVQAARLAMDFRPGDTSAAQAMAMALFGMPATAWLGLDTLAKIDGWIDAGRTTSARQLRQLRDDAARVLAKSFPDSRFGSEGLSTRQRSWWQFW